MVLLVLKGLPCRNTVRAEIQMSGEKQGILHKPLVHWSPPVQHGVGSCKPALSNFAHLALLKVDGRFPALFLSLLTTTKHSYVLT
jgi:hypothetical protein